MEITRYTRDHSKSMTARPCIAISYRRYDMYDIIQTCNEFNQYIITPLAVLLLVVVSPLLLSKSRFPTNTKYLLPCCICLPMLTLRFLLLSCWLTEWFSIPFVTPFPLFFVFTLVWQCSTTVCGLPSPVMYKHMTVIATINWSLLVAGNQSPP